MNPELQDLYAGLSDVVLLPERFELGEGVILSQTYAHLMAPFLMAFAPAVPGKAHPAPWKPAAGGFSIDINAELCLPAAFHLEHLDRLNTIWWITALLRLKATAPVYAPVISSERFRSIPAIEQEPEFLPMEIFTHRILPEHQLNPKLDTSELEWLRANWRESSKLLTNEQFSNAFQAVDQSIWGAEPSASPSCGLGSVGTAIFLVEPRAKFQGIS
jgi:hypothetical protein